MQAKQNTGTLCRVNIDLSIILALRGNSKIKWNFKKNKNLKVKLNTVCQWLVVCLKFM